MIDDRRARGPSGSSSAAHPPQPDDRKAPALNAVPALNTLPARVAGSSWTRWLWILAGFAGVAVWLAIVAQPDSSPTRTGETDRRQAACADWNSPAFFEAATVAEVSRCLATGADLEARDETGGTPLHLAARFSDSPSVVAALLEAGASIEARTEFGETPLHWAATFSDSPLVVTTLLDAGADETAEEDSDATAWELMHGNPTLYRTDVYWRLNEGRFR